MTGNAPLFQRVLGAAWDQLPSELRAVHSGAPILAGKAQVEHGRGPVAWIVTRAFSFPPPGSESPLTVTMTPDGMGEHWHRRFGDHSLHSHLTPGRATGLLNERFGIFTFEQPLDLRDDALWFPVSRGWCLGLPMPRMFLPKSITREFVVDGRFNFDVELHAPLGFGRIVRYKGWLKETT